MACTEKDPAGLAERYLGGWLDPAEATRFEEHFFSCERCVAELRALESIRTELARTRESIETRSRPSHLAPWLAAAAVVLASGAAFYLLRGAPRVPEPGPERATSTLAELARIDPPHWAPMRVRGAGTEAEKRFRQAMEPYARGEWSAALPTLREASRLDPEAADVAFYLGACALLAGQRATGVESLRRVVALGETPYLEEARLYLAKAYLVEGDFAAARAELSAAVELGGPRLDESRELLNRLETMRPRSP